MHFLKIRHQRIPSTSKFIVFEPFLNSRTTKNWVISSDISLISCFSIHCWRNDSDSKRIVQLSKEKWFISQGHPDVLRRPVPRKPVLRISVFVLFDWDYVVSININSKKMESIQTSHDVHAINNWLFFFGVSSCLRIHQYQSLPTTRWKLRGIFLHFRNIVARVVRL